MWAGVPTSETEQYLLCVTMLTMLLLEVTRTSCCYHDLPLTAESSFFSNRVVRIWNNLPIDVDFTSVKSFVRAISRISFTIYCDFNV